MPQHHLQLRALLRLLAPALVAALFTLIPTAVLHAQPSPVHGYITAVYPPEGFDVNGEHVQMTADTAFGPIGAKDPPVRNGPLRDLIAVGAWVEAYGDRDRSTKTLTAQTVLIRDDQNQKLAALALILKVDSTAPELVFEADGYRVRVTQTTEVRLPKDVKSQAGVHAGQWVLYEGKLAQDGLLDAGKARFLSDDRGKDKSAKVADVSSNPSDTPPANAGPVAANAQSLANATDQAGTNICAGDTIDFDDSNSYKISKDQALQARVRRIGMNLVPAYQKRLPETDPDRINFLFCAIENGVRDDLRSSNTILVPAKLAARFQNDDQLAAVLADGIAYTLQQQTPPLVLVKPNRAELTKAAVMGAAAMVPYAGAGVASTYNLYESDKAAKEQRERVALALMADAGYDPWEAPEAWRLAAPNKVPFDIGKLKYPGRSEDLLEILNRLYRRPATISATTSGALKPDGTDAHATR
jgi:hypothetical protein